MGGGGVKNCLRLCDVIGRPLNEAIMAQHQPSNNYPLVSMRDLLNVTLKWALMSPNVSWEGVRQIGFFHRIRAFQSLFLFHFPKTYFLKTVNVTTNGRWSPNIMEGLGVGVLNA